jgi:2,4-dienoyl-CoA reductase-like NADH-dependent reductase (Old Yellow Enzyme family)
MRHLFTPFNFGDLTLPHRVAMAPMTRWLIATKFMNELEC